jgi:hypothetical protein
LLAGVRGALSFQFRTNTLFLPDQKNASAQVMRCLNRTFNLDGGSVVPAHGVNGYGGEHLGKGRLRIDLP